MRLRFYERNAGTVSGLLNASSDIRSKVCVYVQTNSAIVNYTHDEHRLIKRV